ncbi:hypothetical protein QWJ26_07350 [Streptomyces sp. CSDS2]|uniref:hypothetical protein n=1 Tax=Streptomyces sp. CSDS2 TaxID=3055051 RepID=UPI0025B110D1|nr:hypothetical protein [Streptomyces sp. CSDS2]MDN3259634.1 hypothetical protein [Streptomyces sp. CSDS2]
MTKNEGLVPGGLDYAEATSELRRILAARMRGRRLPPDLVVTTRSEIERREFRAYGQGWRDRGERDGLQAGGSGPAPRAAGGAQDPPERPPAPRPPGPCPHPSGPPTARPHPSDDPS